MAKKRKARKGKIILFILVLVVILGVAWFILFKNKPKENANKVEVIDSIDKFGYQLNDNETDYYNELFGSLKKLLLSDSYSEEEYAVIIGQLFLADFYDLNSKVMKSDIGGTQFVYDSYHNDFELGAMNSVYKFIESNVYGDRKQSLPIVKNVSKTDLSVKAYSSNLVTDNSAYYLTMNITYDKDLGYPTVVSLILVHNNDKLEIVSMES